jgi:hypothetical protein
MKFSWVIAAIFALALVAVYLGKPQGSESVSREEAINYALRDARNSFSSDYDGSVLGAVQENGKWKITIQITLEPHSKCPQVVNRQYELFPLLYRDEKIVSGCNLKKPILRREEAIIDSVVLVPKARDYSYSCAFKLPARVEESYCAASEQELSSVASGATKGWIVQWESQTGKFFVVMDDEANVLKTQ